MKQLYIILFLLCENIIAGTDTSEDPSNWKETTGQTDTSEDPSNWKETTGQTDTSEDPSNWKETTGQTPSNWTTGQTGTTGALDPQIESALRDIENLGIIDTALDDFLGPFDEFLNKSGRLDDVGSTGSLPDGWAIDLQPLQQLPQWPNCTELARYMVFLYSMSEQFDPNNITAESAEMAKNLMGKLTAAVYTRAYETCPRTSYVNGNPPVLPPPGPPFAAPADTVATILRKACKEFRRDYIQKLLCDLLKFVIDNIGNRRPDIKRKAQLEYDKRCRCPPKANNGICFQDGIKGCYRLGNQPAGWKTGNIRCVANIDCWCYHNPCPPNANPGCFQAGVKGCYSVGNQPQGWTTRNIRCVANMNCLCYHAPDPVSTTVPTTVQGCNCQPCKEILHGPYAGIWTLISSMAYNCDAGCEYVKGGEIMCFCDPGPDPYIECDDQ